MANWGTFKSSLAELKAIPTAFLNKGVPTVLGSIWYFYDPDSSVVPDDYLVIKPDDINNSSGRWIVEGRELLGHLNQPNSWPKSQRSQPTNLAINPQDPTLAIDCKESNYFLLNATQNFTVVTPSNSESGRWFILSVAQPATPFLISWSDSTFKYSNKTRPQLTPEPGAIDEILFRCRSGGVSPVWLVSFAGNFGEVV